MSYPSFTRAERIADGSMHALGVAFAITGAVFLMIWSMDHGWQVQTASAIYGATLIATFLASACYHMTPWEGPRPILRRIDHAAIFVKIAGTYTPLVVLLGTGFAYALLGVVWALAAVGVILKLAFWRTPGPWAVALPLIMGWLSALLIWPIWESLPWVALPLIVAGGVIYSLGVVFYLADNLKFSNAIWHGFVLVASVCLFTAIAVATQAAV